MREFKNGTPIEQIAQMLGRGAFSVEVRLVKLGASIPATPPPNPPAEASTSATSPPSAPIRRTDRVVALGESGDLAHVGELIESLGDPDGNVRRLAASALGKLRATEAVEPLLELLAGETGPQVRQYSIVALGRIGDSRAIPSLQRIAEDSAEKGYNRIAAWDAVMLIRARA
jgi:HEAT repeat protein